MPPDFPVRSLADGGSHFASNSDVSALQPLIQICKSASRLTDVRSEVELGLEGIKKQM